MMTTPVFHGSDQGDAKVICIVVHGRGQTQADMMDSIVARVAVPDVRFVLPKSEGHGWYAARAIDPLSDETLIAMHDGVREVTALIKAERSAAPDVPVLLCGFSQGACLSVETLMCQPAIVEAVCLFTACRIGAATDTLPLKQLGGLPVYASCGDADQWIPAEAHHRMLADLTRAGARLRTDMFPGRPHEVTDTEITVLSGMLRALAGGTPVWDVAA
jgi:phospholipase/carboxylesterase